MLGTRSPFDPEPAPCGRTVGGTTYREADDAGLVIYHMTYECGCRLIRHEYHDGSVTTQAIRHGRRHKVILDEHAAHPL